MFHFKRRPNTLVFFFISLALLLVVIATCGGDGAEAPTATPTSPPAATATPVPSDGGVPTPTPAPATQDEAGIPQPVEYQGEAEVAGTEELVPMEAVGDSGVTGSARLVQVLRKTKVEIMLENAPAGPLKADVRRGRCTEDVGSNQIDYALFSVENGESVSVINIPTSFFRFNRNVIVVHAENSRDSPVIACGNIPTVFG